MGEKPALEDGGTRLSADLVFEVLADRHRRAILRTLDRREGVVTVEQLVTESLSATDETSPGTTGFRSLVLARFCHVHLPKLTDAELIEYWPRQRLVEPKPVIEQLQPFLELAEPFERPLDPDQ